MRKTKKRRAQAKVSWIYTSSLRLGCPVQLKPNLFEEIPILFSSVKGDQEGEWNRIPKVGLSLRPIQLWRDTLNFIIYVNAKCQACSSPWLKGKRVGRHHREEEEPFLTLLSEYNYILLILNAILAGCEKFKDHRMIKYKVKVYPMLLAPRRNNC